MVFKTTRKGFRGKKSEDRLLTWVLFWSGLTAVLWEGDFLTGGGSVCVGVKGQLRVPRCLCQWPLVGFVKWRHGWLVFQGGFCVGYLLVQGVHFG